MGAFDLAVTERQGRNVEVVDAEEAEAGYSAGDVDEGVDCADFVKLHRFDRRTVDLSLDFAEGLED